MQSRPDAAWNLFHIEAREKQRRWVFSVKLENVLKSTRKSSLLNVTAGWFNLNFVTKEKNGSNYPKFYTTTS